MKSGVRRSLLLVRRSCLVVSILFATSSHAAGSEALFAASLTAPNGETMALSAYQGKPMIVNFWARWCMPCRQEIPELRKVHEKYSAQGLVVLGVGVENSPEAVREFMQAYEMNYPVGLANGQNTGQNNGQSSVKGIWLMQTLGNKQAGLPFTLAINRQGEIVMRKLGVMTGAEIEATARSLLN